MRISWRDHQTRRVRGGLRGCWLSGSAVTSWCKALLLLLPSSAQEGRTEAEQLHLCFIHSCKTSERRERAAESSQVAKACVWLMSAERAKQACGAPSLSNVKLLYASKLKSESESGMDRQVSRGVSGERGEWGGETRRCENRESDPRRARAPESPAQTGVDQSCPSEDEPEPHQVAERRTCIA